MFELFVAWRYLRERGRRSGFTTLSVGGGLLLLAGICGILAANTHMSIADMAEGARDWKQTLAAGAMGFALLGVLVVVFGFFHWMQSIFTTISTFGIFLGTAALVIVLSVMNGFEVDLRGKILGSNAHILISKEDGAFTEYRDVESKVKGMCGGGTCVVAVTPYVSSEVVVSANQNYNSVVIKGIEPGTVGGVTELEKNLSRGVTLDKLWPLTVDGEPVPYTRRPDAGAASQPVDDDKPPDDFSGGGAASAPAVKQETDDEPPIDFSQGKPDAGFGRAREIKVNSLGFEERLPRVDPRLAQLDGVLVGRELAKNLHLYAGQEVDVVSPLGQDSPTGQTLPRVRGFRVAGSFYTGMYEYDTKFVYVSMPALQSFLGTGDEVTGVEIKTSDVDATGPLVEKLRETLGPSFRVADWQELNRSLFSALKLEKIAMFIVLSIIILVASFSIVSNLIMVVVEKAREIAILKSMGASNYAVMKVFVIEGLYMGLLGTSIGLIVGVGTCLALARFGLPLNPDVYYIDKLPVAMDPVAISFVAFAGVAIAVAATIYPSYVGATLRPVDGLRNE